MQVVQSQRENIIDKIQRAAYFINNNLRQELSSLIELTPALDLITNCPHNSVHSEYFRLIRRIYLISYSKILTITAAVDFSLLFCRFSFSSDYGCIQSRITHMTL